MIKPYYETKNGKLYNMDCLEMLRQMPENSVDRKFHPTAALYPPAALI